MKKKKKKNIGHKQTKNKYGEKIQLNQTEKKEEKKRQKIFN